jgi:nucleotide-binding universal stress UspA family protein
MKLGRKRPYAAAGRPRILVPFAGELDPTVLDAAIRIARAEEAVLVPAYLLLVPLDLGPESAATGEVEVAVPLLEAVEQAALREGVPVDARIERGRSPTHALTRLWEVERFDRIVVAAGRFSGFTATDLAWILTHAPSETMILKPAPEPNSPVSSPPS